MSSKLRRLAVKLSGAKSVYVGDDGDEDALAARNGLIKAYVKTLDGVVQPTYDAQGYQQPDTVRRG